MANPNNLNPNFDRVSLRNGPTILAGVATTSATILADVGTTPNVNLGSLYLTTGGTTTTVVFCLLINGWTPLTIN
jgi:hypothetical protein